MPSLGAFQPVFYHNDGQNDDLDKCGEEDHDHDHDDHCITMVSTGDLSDSLPESSRILEFQGGQELKNSSLLRSSSVSRVFHILSDSGPLVS